MLDTCILVNFYLVRLKEERKIKIPQPLIKSKELLKRFEESKFEHLMTDWNKWELRKVVSRKVLEQKFVLAGYSTNEFGDARKEVYLEKRELKLVNKVVADTWLFCFRRDGKLTNDEERKIEELTKKGFGFMDCLLILLAKKHNCDFFVTKDRRLREIDGLSKEFKIEVIGIKAFLDKVRDKKK